VRSLTDASGIALALSRPPRRIVSLIPSITETLCRLGLADALVGVTAYCVEPAAVVRGKTRIGGEKDPDLEKIRALEPDLVVANIEENVREHIETLRAWSIPVWVTYPRTVAQALAMIRELGEVTGATAEAAALLAELEPLAPPLRAAGPGPRPVPAAGGAGARGARGPPSGAGVLSDLARAVDDDRPRHVHPRPAGRVRGRQRLRRSRRAVSDGHARRDGRAPAGGDRAP
jgi:hypothetical protein